MRRWISLWLMLAISLGIASPVLACLAPAVSISMQPSECCSHMDDVSCPPPAMPCCSIGSNAPAVPAAVSDQQIVVALQAVTVMHAPSAARLFDSLAAPMLNIPAAPAHSLSVLRI